MLGVTFAGLNARPVILNYYVGNAELPLSLLLVLSFSGGCVLGLLVSLVLYIKLKNSNRRLRHRLKNLEEEVANLRTIPLKDAH